MKNNIVINGASIKNEQQGVVLEYYISKKEDSVSSDYTIQFKFDDEYKDYISHEVADGIIVIILSYAIRGGYDIETKIPLSSELYYRLQFQLIPQLCLCCGYDEISIKCDLLSPNYNPHAVATAMSCGVDSFATLFEYTSDNIPDDRKITHLTFFQNGAHHGGYVGHSDDEQVIFESQLNHVKKFCDEYNWKLIVVASDVDKKLSEIFWEDPFDRTHTYRNAGIVLLLQKFIKTYYYAGSYNLNDFLCAIDESPAHYEKFLLPNISTDYTNFYNSSGSMTRIEKIQYISSFEETWNHLLVCYSQGYNCGNCVKCRRTMLELYFTNNIDKYANIFPVETFKSNYKDYIIWLLDRRDKNSIMEDIINCIKENNIKIPKYYYIISDFRRIGIKIVKKLSSIDSINRLIDRIIESIKK